MEGGISQSQGLYLHTDIPALCVIRTHGPSLRASEDSSCLRTRGHCDRQSYSVVITFPTKNKNDEVCSSRVHVISTCILLFSHNSLSSVCIYCSHVRWVPCHHGMARPQVADGGDSLQFWRVAANMLNKLSRTADKGWSFSLGVWRGANNSSP
jgi:hypothetical protein